MEQEVLFQVTKESLETGLRGVPVGYCPTSTVDSQKGLFYVGHPIDKLAQWDPERVIFLLYRGYEGTDKELQAFKKDLKKRAFCSSEALEHVLKLPRVGHSMSLYAAALLILGMYEATGDYNEDCLNLIAKTPQLTATVINHHAGWGATPASRPELGYIENFSQMLNVPQGKDSQLEKLFKLFNILHYDHGGGNLSVFVGKAVASGLDDLYGSVCSAMNALAGPLHGRANQQCLYFVQEALDKLGEKAEEKDVEEFIRNKLAKKELIFGFGHAVLRVEDPRATVLYQFGQKHYTDHPLVKMALLIRSAGSKVLKETGKVASPYTNVDAVSGVLLSAAGFTYPQYYTMLFGMARIVGISIQIVYERCQARGGKGTPIVRPKYLYKEREKPKQ
ncbi:MAG: citrate (Si)-synthase [Chlamydiales bacterium]